jgi:hypothetical protein
MVEGRLKPKAKCMATSVGLLNRILSPGPLVSLLRNGHLAKDGYPLSPGSHLKITTVLTSPTSVFYR